MSPSLPRHLVESALNQFSTPDSLVGKIASLQNRERFQNLHWEGTFEDYLRLVREDPRTCRTRWSARGASATASISVRSPTLCASASSSARRRHSSPMIWSRRVPTLT